MIGGRAWAILLAGVLSTPGFSQEIVRPPAPRSEDFEVDTDSDGVPDGWYNLRDATLVKEGGPSGPRFLRFVNAGLGRQARASRAFGVDGRKTEALVIGVWVKVRNVHTGERLGEDASLQIDFLGDGLVATGRGVIGPWNSSLGEGWVHVEKRIAVPAGTRDAIMTTGLLGAVGTLEVDGLTIDEVPVGGATTTNLILNGDFELGSSTANSWTLEDGAKRTCPGHKSLAMLELSGSGAKALNGLACRADRLSEIDVRLFVSGKGLRASGGGRASFYFLDAEGRPLTGADEGARLFRWSGSFDWKEDHATARVPSTAVRAVLQFEIEGTGLLRVDDIEVLASGNSGGPWTPYHVETDTLGWRPLEPSPGIVAGSALDASGLLHAPAGSLGPVVVKEGHLHYATGPRARFFGVVVLPPLAFPDRDLADSLADRLSRSGINLVRFEAMDSPLGPGRSLYDDGRDDTKGLDADAMAKFDHFVAALKARGVYVTLDLLASRRFRGGDGAAGSVELPSGGGPASGFDPGLRALAIEASESLLGHVNPETGLSLRDDPVLAWVSLAGEVSLFDRIDSSTPLPVPFEARFKELLKRPNIGSGRRAWQAIESAQWKAIADALRKFGLKRPIAGSSHWRREPEFVAAQAAAGLDLIDDRLYWSPPRFGAPERRSMVWRAGSGLSTESARKRKGDRPYVVSSWCAHTDGVWALPYEGADLMFVARTSNLEEWDALARRGVFLYPREWGASAPGTTGRQDLFALAEVINANPQVYSLLPHAASLYLSGAKPKKTTASAWDPSHGRLVIDTPHTQGVAGSQGRKATNLESVTIEPTNPFAVLMVSSLGPEPISQSKRILVTAVARAESEGLTYVDAWKREVASPGHPPILVEPVKARVTWKRPGPIKAYALKPDGSRGEAVEVTSSAVGQTLELRGESSTLHWEMTE